MSLSSSKGSFHVRQVCVVLALVLVLFSGQAMAASKVSQLPQRYRDWLQKEVLWIISDDEKKAFLDLTNDDQRDEFIQHFWDIRNPTPGAPDNPYKTEHYKRYNYAIQYFSTGADDGYKTDRGRIYIIMGPPQQKAHQITQSETKPLEIWFYQNAHPLFLDAPSQALPAFFNVLFYERDPGNWKMYSPLFDGPAKLVNSHHAENGLQEAVEAIQRDLGSEVANASLSLVPGEPVNWRNPTITMTSDIMLNTLKDLRNHPFTIDVLNERGRLYKVSKRIIIPGEYLNVTTVPLKDLNGDFNLHYAMRLNKAEDFGVGQRDNKFYYAVEAAVRVMTLDGKPIFTQEKKFSRNLTDAEMARHRDKAFGVEGVLPLAPGKYKLEFLLTNVLKRTTFTTEKTEVVIPSPTASGWRLSPVTAFIGAENLSREQLGEVPFSFGPVKFVPMVDREIALTPGQDLQVFFQILGPEGDPKRFTGKKLILDYGYGSLSVSGSTHSIREEIAKDQLDARGTMITGKSFPTNDLQPGIYRMAITLTDPDTLAKATTSLTFKLLSSGEGAGSAWDIYAEDYAQDENRGTNEFQRALTYLAQGDQNAAAARLEQLLKRDPSNESVRARLVEYYFGQKKFDQVLALYSSVPVTAKVDDDTVLRVADSYDKSGNLKGAADFIESALAAKGPSGSLYVSLASYYQRLGNPQKADELDRKGRSLLNTPVTPSS